jgi:hypothetical protein
MKYKDAIDALANGEQIIVPASEPDECQQAMAYVRTLRHKPLPGKRISIKVTVLGVTLARLPD